MVRANHHSLPECSPLLRVVTRYLRQRGICVYFVGIVSKHSFAIGPVSGDSNQSLDPLWSSCCYPPPPTICSPKTVQSTEGGEGKEKRERIIVVVGSPCHENCPADAHPSAHKSVLESANPAWTWSVHLDAPGQRHRQQPVSRTADPGVVKQDKSSRGSVDTMIFEACSRRRKLPQNPHTVFRMSSPLICPTALPNYASSDILTRFFRMWFARCRLPRLQALVVMGLLAFIVSCGDAAHHYATQMAQAVSYTTIGLSQASESPIRGRSSSQSVWGKPSTPYLHRRSRKSPYAPHAYSPNIEANMPQRLRTSKPTTKMNYLMYAGLCAMGAVLLLYHRYFGTNCCHSPRDILEPLDLVGREHEILALSGNQQFRSPPWMLRPTGPTTAMLGYVGDRGHGHLKRKGVPSQNTTRSQVGMF